MHGDGFNDGIFYTMMAVVSVVLFVCMMSGFAVGKRYGDRVNQVNPILQMLNLPVLVAVSELSVLWAMFQPGLTAIGLLLVALSSFGMGFMLMTGKPKER